MEKPVPKAPWSAVALATAVALGFHGGSLAAAVQGASRISSFLAARHPTGISDSHENTQSRIPLPRLRDQNDNAWAELSTNNQAPATSH